jgi:hypothetical protein
MFAKRATAALALTLLSGPLALAQVSASPFTGTWRMTSLEVAGAGGARQTVPYSLQIVFTEAGAMSVQAMNPDPNASPT